MCACVRGVCVWRVGCNTECACACPCDVAWRVACEGRVCGVWVSGVAGQGVEGRGVGGAGMQGWGMWWAGGVGELVHVAVGDRDFMVGVGIGLGASELEVYGRRNVARVIGVFGVHLMMDCRTLFTVIRV